MSACPIKSSTERRKWLVAIVTLIFHGGPTKLANWTLIVLQPFSCFLQINRKITPASGDYYAPCWRCKLQQQQVLGSPKWLLAEPDNNSPESLNAPTAWTWNCCPLAAPWPSIDFFYYRSRYGVSLRNVSVMGPPFHPLVSCISTSCLSIFNVLPTLPLKKSAR